MSLTQSLIADGRIQPFKVAIVAKIKAFIKDFKEENLPSSFNEKLTELLNKHPASSSDTPVKKEDLNTVFATLDCLMSGGFVMRAKGKGGQQFDLTSIATDVKIQTPISKTASAVEKPENYKLQQDFIKLINKIPASQNEEAQKAREKLILVALALSGETSTAVMEKLDKVQGNTYIQGYLYLVAQLYNAMYPGATEQQIIGRVNIAKGKISELNGVEGVSVDATKKFQAIFTHFQNELAETQKVHQAWMQKRQKELYLIPGLIMDVGDLQTLYQQAKNDFAGQCYKAMALGKTTAATATAAAATSFEKDLLQLNEEEKKHVETVEYSGGMLGKSVVKHCVKEFEDALADGTKYPAGSSILETNGEPLTINMVRIWLSTFAAGYRVLDVSRINNTESVNIAIPSDNGVGQKMVVTVTARKLVEIVAQTPPLNHIVIGGHELPETGFANESDLQELRAYVTKEMNVPLKMMMDSSNKPAYSSSASVSLSLPLTYDAQEILRHGGRPENISLTEKGENAEGNRAITNANL